MILNPLKWLKLCIVTGLIASFCCFALDNAVLAGEWNMTSETDGDAVHWTLVLKDEHGTLAGFVTAGQAQQPAKDFKLESGLITFKAPYQGQDYDIQLKLTGNKLDGTWTGDGNSGRTFGTKTQ